MIGTYNEALVKAKLLTACKSAEAVNAEIFNVIVEKLAVFNESSKLISHRVAADAEAFTVNAPIASVVDELIIFCEYEQRPAPKNPPLGAPSPYVLPYTESSQ